MLSAGTPRVSVVIPTYNVAPYIGSAIDSVLAQSFEDFEVIVMDDGSRDGTPEIAARYVDKRIEVCRRGHRGPTFAMNEAVDLARGVLIAFLDGDDLWGPEKLRRHVEFMGARCDLDLTFCRSRMVNEQGRELRVTSPSWSGPLTYRDLLVSNPAGNGSSIVAKRDALIRAGGFDTSFLAGYDQELWLRLSLLRPNNITSLPEIHTYYRRRSGQITASPSVMEEAWCAIVEKHRGLHPELVAELEGQSRSNLCRYLGALAYECGDYRAGLRWMKESLCSSPWLFLRTSRSYLVVCALLAREIWSLGTLSAAQEEPEARALTGRASASTDTDTKLKRRIRESTGCV